MSCHLLFIGWWILIYFGLLLPDELFVLTVCSGSWFQPWPSYISDFTYTSTCEIDSPPTSALQQEIMEGQEGPFQILIRYGVAAST